ncbi:hypothetical protein [Streptomyces sp. NPDC005125]
MFTTRSSPAPDAYGIRAIGIDIENTVVQDRILGAPKIVKQNYPGLKTIVTIARSDRQFTSITAGFTGRPGCQQSLRYPDFGCPTGMSLDRPAVGPRACGRAPPHRRTAWAGASPLRIRAGR